jgi:Flp pilus assembly protein TadG
MEHSIFSMFRSFRGFLRHQQKGSTLVLAAALVPGVIAVAGLSIDVGRAFAAKRALAAQTQAAAMAGAYALTAANATTSTVTTAVSSWTTANPASSFITLSGSPTPTLSCVTSTSSLPSCNGTSPNAVSFSQTGTVPTYFLKAFGVSTFTVSASAIAAKGGGNAKSVNIMFVLDATGSMGNADSGCTVPGISGSPTRWQCANYSVQKILKTMPKTLDKVGLMVFPGMATQYSPTSHPCPTQPNSVPYYTSTIKYQIGTTLDNTYNDGAGSLVSTSPIVQAVGWGTTSSTTGCLTNKGGEGSYAAEVLTKAQATLGTPATGTSNVIILLSDGDYGASSTQLNGNSQGSSKVTAQCGQAVTAAQAATTAGTTVYSVAYGAPSTGCSTGDTYNPCSAMKAIASDPTKFYSSDSSCQIAGSANAVGQLPALFQAITTSLTKPRLLTQ